MGKAAARQGDITAHGGVIVSGFPTVLIGGQPAARQLDLHTCPMLDGPKPHVGGPILLGSPTVLIGGQAAARQGDPATCVGPPDTIAMGLPSVLIGEAGGGGGSGGGGGGPSGSGGGSGGSGPGLIGDPESITKEPHWVEIECVDVAGLPVSGIPYELTMPDDTVSEGVLRLDGTIRRDGLPAGTCTVVLMSVSQAQWSAATAKVGDPVTMRARVEGFDPGTTALFQVFKRDLNRPDVVVDEVEAEVQGETVEVEWTFAYPEDLQTSGGYQEVIYSKPVFYFEVVVGRCQARSGLLEWQDLIEFALLDPYNQPVAQADYVLYLADGEIRKGKLDNRGRKKEEPVPITPWSIEFPGQEEITIQESKANLTKL